ncbi:dihydroxyacetone kinase phosphoryl donor subunit DhaM [Arthrobacter sp. 35W]|uniref:dihydroxyacetone kinase phosphoryl donor subunit DhaM n=1 Tax=Arthrobacter sp. 35W TaxID=1132441 RepID=UPI00040FB243|nr:dihydroxyacetone kinase phosphoryl donor subunit DhaM [Arthrobacter sp. 35W]
MRVGLVIVSHSAQLADGLVELAAQMAPDVTLLAAGGMDAGPDGVSGIGTSLEKVMDAVSGADAGAGVLVLADLGSAVMTAEAALEFLGGPENVVLAHAALVEGAVAAAVTAQSGADLELVKKAAETAFTPVDGPVQGGTGGGTAVVDPPAPSGAGNGAVSAELQLINPMGLHARPAATLAGALGAMDVDIEINGVDGQSVMMLMTLGAGEGTTLSVTASGSDAARAVDLVRTEVENGFGEL